MKKYADFLVKAIVAVSCISRVAAQTDAGISSVVSPAVPFCPGSNPVAVLLTNYGSDTVFSVTVNWTVNGAAQSPYAWSGVLAPAASDTVTLGAYLFNGKTSYSVMAASDLPNGMPDADPANDSFTASGLKSRMSGNYSAGVVADYPVLLDAVNDVLNRGVCGPVTVNINPGIFAERLVIREIPGASAVNTVTFQSSTADSTSVIISQPSSPDATDNYTVLLDGADFVTLRQLTVERSGVQPYSRVVEISGKAAGNVLTGLRIAGVAGATNASLTALVYSDTSNGTGSVDSLNEISGCAFLDGASGLYWAGPDPSLPEQGNRLTGNVFSGQTAYGVRLDNQSGVEVSGNTFRSSSAGAGYIAAAMVGCTAKSQVLRNRMEDIPGCGVLLSKCAGDSTGPFTMANNFVHVSDSAGIRIDGCSNMAVVFNSVHQSSADTSACALQLSGQCAQVDLADNVVVNSGNGPALAVRDSAQNGLARSDYNDWYAAGRALCDFNGTLLSSLADWRQSTALDTHSVSADPGFTGASDLHASSWVIDNAGVPVGNVGDDIDGEMRHATTPDIGADEFTALVHDLALLALVHPDTAGCGDSTLVVRVAVANTGSFPETGFTVSAALSGTFTAQLSMVYGGNLAAGAVDTVVFGQAVQAAAGGQFVVTASVFSGFDVIPSNDTLVVPVSLDPLLPPATAAPVSVCGTDTVTLSAAGTATVYWYEDPAGGLPLDSGSVFSFLAAASDTFYVQNGSGCVSPRTPVVATVFPLPVVSLGSDTVLTVPNTLLLDAGTGFAAYAWNTGDTTATIVAGTTGLYAVTVTDSNGCEGADTIQVTVVTSTLELSHGLEVYPNPAREYLSVVWPYARGRELTVEVTDAAGRRVCRTTLQAGQDEGRVRIGLDGWTAGVYFLSLTIDGSTVKRRFVLQ